uniref:AB hydrolase-1 domain-containing protein n=1 Tax=Globisporangium ultimum (strain ATCC 200006 / CBS 805.95 / DAOM BR144) TaxID=431595 RepID=K3WZ18_GLOUD
MAKTSTQRSAPPLLLQWRLLQNPMSLSAFRKPAFVVAAVVCTPILVCVAALWAVLGHLCTRRTSVAATVALLITWSAHFLCGYHDGASTGALHLPSATSLAVVAVGIAPIRSTWLMAFAVGAAAASVVSARHNILLQGGHNTHSVSALMCLLPAWVAICKLRLWCPADERVLHDIEHAIYRTFAPDHEIHLRHIAGLGTVHVPYSGEKMSASPRALVLVHGYLAGNAFWAANLEELSKHFDVIMCPQFAVEWKGIGRSARPTFIPKSDEEADAFFVESLEEWRREMQAMFSTYYSSKYAKHVEHLVLISPAGVNPSPLTRDQLSLPAKMASAFLITPMSLVRFAGPIGPHLAYWLVRRRVAKTPPANIIRTGEMDLQRFALYCYHNWALKASGDIAYYTHLHPGASARTTPLSDLLVPGKASVPVTFLYGDVGVDWMNHEHGEAVVRQLEKAQYAMLRCVPLAGHQVFMDNPKGFNRALVQAIKKHDVHMRATSTRTP